MSRSIVGAHKMEVSFPGVFSARLLLPENEGCITTILGQAECARKCKKLRHRVVTALEHIPPLRQPNLRAGGRNDPGLDLTRNPHCWDLCENVVSESSRGQISGPGWARLWKTDLAENNKAQRLTKPSGQRKPSRSRGVASRPVESSGFYSHLWYFPVVGHLHPPDLSELQSPQRDKWNRVLDWCEFIYY